MSPALTLPLIGLLIGIPGIPGLKKLPKLKREKAVVDTIPPVWKPHSLLALESRFVFATMPPIGPQGVRLKVNNDPRRLQMQVDSDSGTVTATTELGEVPLGEGIRVPIGEFHREQASLTFRRQWQERSRQSVNTVAGGSEIGGQRHSGLQFNLPVNLPKAYTSILGPGGPAINVSGSENIKLSGTSEWTNQETGFLGQRRSLFPSLDMEQDLDIRLEGQLSDRVKVNLLQNSATQIPLANKIAINYKGDEDDLVQALDLGNTNLTLPGTQYVSYSGRNEGLFGMKATTRLGPLDFTVLASKQEGKSERASYAGGASSQKQVINDYDYVKGTYFFLYDPNEAYDPNDPNDPNRPKTIDNGSIRLFFNDPNISTALRPTAQAGRAVLDPEQAVFDTCLSCAPDSTPPSPALRGYWVEQTQDVGGGGEFDYEILDDFYGPYFKVIRLKRGLSGEQSLAVIYRYTDNSGQLHEVGGREITDIDGGKWLTMKLIRPPFSQTPGVSPASDAFFRTDTLMAAARELELRNIYNLNGQSIDVNSFKLTIRRGVDDPPITVLQGPSGEQIPYIEALGLDSFDETSTGVPIRGQHDGRIDGTLPAQASRYFIDYTRGTIWFPDLRPFAPRVKADPAYPPSLFEKDISTFVFRRDSLVGPPGAQNERNRDIYDQRNPIRNQVSLYYMDVEFSSQRLGNEINLGRSNIIEGSDAVTVGGRRLERDRDYTIDYDLGRVTLKATPGPTEQVSVDYSYAPLFQQAGRTLLGSAFRLEGRDKHVGGAFMYESKGAQDLRPRLGEEPSRVVIGDLNGGLRTRPEFLTRLVDALPGVRTTAPSEFNLDYEVGASLPNPNTFNEVFVDDMEGVRDAVSLALTPDRWTWSSTPSRIPSEPIQLTQRNAETHWFTPLNAVKERDLKPLLTDAQGAQNSRQALAISVPRRPPGASPDTAMWVGLTYLLDPVGIDLSRSQFIELWVNDFRNTDKSPRNPAQSLKLHVDLGVVSEDQRRSPFIDPDDDLNSEDLRPRDQKLTVVGENNEDTGLDGLLNGVEHPDGSLVTAGRTKDPSAEPDNSVEPDQAGDDYRDPRAITSGDDPILNLEPSRWLDINGTEGNGKIFTIPDTEDLNRNDNFETTEDYLEYTIDLAASPYLADSVYIEPGQPGFPRVYVNNFEPVRPDNGWRRYRIPLTDSLRARFGSPDLSVARHVRLWVEGIRVTDDSLDAQGRERPLLMIGGIEIVGSRWLVGTVTPEQFASGTSVTLNSVNNVDNADIYIPPFDPGQTRNGSQDLTRREQSLELEFQQLLPGDTLEVFKTFSLDEDYTRYDNLRFYVAGPRVDAYTPPVAGAVSDSLFYFLRFASDERGFNYYEYRAPVPGPAGAGVNWSEVLLRLTDLSNLKLDLAAPRDTLADGSERIQVPGAGTGVTLIVKGRPSFTRLRRISTGVINLEATTVYPMGRLWVDEVRATDVARDRGFAQRFGVSGRMSNLFGYNITYNARDEDFLSVGETRGSGNRMSNWSASANFDLHRFFAGTGIVLPVTYSLSGSRALPRYSAGDDVVRIGAFAEASRSRTDTRTWTASFNRTWSERSNPFLRYTLGGFTANTSRTTSESSNPSTVDTSRASMLGVGWSISPRKLLPVPVPFTRFHLFPLPERFYWNYAAQTRSNKTWDRKRDDPDSLLLRSDTRGRAAGVDFGGAFRPIDLLQHQFQARRNLSLAGPLMERIGPINLGKVVQWNQSFSSRYAGNRGLWLRPQVSWNSSYFQNNGPELSPDLSIREINNGQTFNVGWSLPFDQLAGPQRAARADTTRRRGIPAWKRLLSSLGAVSLDAGITRSSRYTRLIGTPSMSYLVGISSDPGFATDTTAGVRPAFGNQSSQSRDFRTGARTRLLLFRGASVQTNADYARGRAEFNNVVNRNERFGFPNFDVDFGRLPETIGLKRLFLNPKLRTVYSRSTTTDFSNSETPTKRSVSQEWRPLVGFTGDFKNGTRAEFRIQRRGTESEIRVGTPSTFLEQNTDVDLSLSRTYTRGQKVTVLGKANTIKTNITLGLTGAYSRKKSETRTEGYDRPLSPNHEDRLNVNARGSYGFSNNVTGNAELGFSQFRDLLTDIVRRSVRVELRAQFNF